jgi:hypothetical protein
MEESESAFPIFDEGSWIHVVLGSQGYGQMDDVR